jgi:radical SAM protein with 4Fe4S-binding SPASM domain
MAEKGQVVDIHRLVKLGRWVEGELQKRVKVRLYYGWPKAFFSLARLVGDVNATCRIFTLLGILPTGHLAMCGIGTQLPELCYGQLGQDRVEDVWLSNRLLIDLRQNLPANLEGVCADCILRNSCLGHCVAENYFASKSLSAPFWFCQAAKESDLFPLTRLQKMG